MLLERAPENDTQDEPTFSAGSMFGTLLTLSTCLLLQPKGSLIFKRPSRLLGRTLFFFLRLDPIVCALEAASVLHALVLILRRAIGSCHGNPCREFGVFAANLQAGAAGVLFLRSHTALRQWTFEQRLDERLDGQAPKRGHTEMVIDLIPLLSVVGTAVKLIASVVPGHFQVICWCYIGGWIVVQLAVMISHCGSSKEQLDSKPLFQSTEYLRQKVDVLESGRDWGIAALIWLMVLLMFIGTISTLGFDEPSVVYYGLLLFALVILVSTESLVVTTMNNFSLRKRRGDTATSVLLVALLATTAILVVYLVLYEEEGTFKPEWLDWLG
ncbi:hypothetical protein MRS44_001467 [Fusarium solani]|uniref:uncharacterized protein n=1 Tax=Fusarium solani TaxID=169388 RepID=UPI0032C43FDF|nr:hypothetical protein MRS44_001467 [Fusarium solani]